MARASASEQRELEREARLRRRATLPDGTRASLCLAVTWRRGGAYGASCPTASFDIVFRTVRTKCANTRGVPPSALRARRQSPGGGVGAARAKQQTRTRPPVGGAHGMAAAASDAQAAMPGCLAPASLELDIEGMTCGACVHSVESALARLPPGLRSSRVTLGHASVSFSPQLLTAADIAQGARCSRQQWWHCVALRRNACAACAAPRPPRAQ